MSPWNVVERPDMNTNAITGDGGAILAYVHDPQDASLIAAAPELLDALRWLLDDAERRVAGFPAGSEEWYAVRDSALADIAKAEGREL